MQCSAVQCYPVQCSAVQCSTVLPSAVQCSAVQCRWRAEVAGANTRAVTASGAPGPGQAVQCSAVQCSAVQCTRPWSGALSSTYTRVVNKVNLSRQVLRVRRVGVQAAPCLPPLRAAEGALRPGVGPLQHQARRRRGHRDLGHRDHTICTAWSGTALVPIVLYGSVEESNKLCRLYYFHSEPGPCRAAPRAEATGMQSWRNLGSTYKGKYHSQCLFV
jgi:hypothetical protein